VTRQVNTTKMSSPLILQVCTRERHVSRRSLFGQCPSLTFLKVEIHSLWLFRQDSSTTEPSQQPVQQPYPISIDCLTDHSLSINSSTHLFSLSSSLLASSDVSKSRKKISQIKTNAEIANASFPFTTPSSLKDMPSKT
jgi:hypothetical protein